MQSAGVERQVRGLQTLAERCQRLSGALRSGDYLLSIPDRIFVAAPREQLLKQ